MDMEKKMESEIEDKQVQQPVRLPKRLVVDLKEAAKKHHRSLNSEIIVAIETFLANWKNKL